MSFITLDGYCLCTISSLIVVLIVSYVEVLKYSYKLLLKKRHQRAQTCKREII